MEQILSLARSLGASSGQTEAPAGEAPMPSSEFGFQPDPRMLSGIASLLGQCSSDDDQRVALLRALKPFVKEQRYARLDKAIRITRLSRMARMALELFRSQED